MGTDQPAIAILTSYRGYLMTRFWTTFVDAAPEDMKSQIQGVYFIERPRKRSVAVEAVRGLAAFPLRDLVAFIPRELFARVSRRALHLLSRSGISYRFVGGSDKNEFMRELTELPREAILVSFNNPLILPRCVLRHFRYCINVHNGKLPEYRGVYAPLWQILNGEKHITISVHMMREEIDSGGVLLTRTVAANGRSLLRILEAVREEDAHALVEALRLLDQGVPAEQEQSGEAHYYSEPSLAVLRQIRRSYRW